jgi:very-short-patch-repair endonuclease
MAEADLFDLAAAQYGVVSRTQTLDTGLSARQIEIRIEAGRLTVVHPGVYRVAGAPTTGRQRAMAACLWPGTDALVSHLTAAALLRLDGCRTTELHLSVPRGVRRRVAQPTVSVHRVRALPRVDRATVDGLPCTTATRALIDCAALLDAEALEVAFESARRMGLTSARALGARAAELASPAGGVRDRFESFSHVSSRRSGTAVSTRGETRAVLRTTDLPKLERQVKVGSYRIDFALRALRVGVEREGFEYHGNRLAWKRDKARTAWLETQGWRLVFVTWDDVTRRPAQTLDRIAIALGLVPSDPAMRGEMAPEGLSGSRRRL